MEEQISPSIVWLRLEAEKASVRRSQVRGHRDLLGEFIWRPSRSFELQLANGNPLRRSPTAALASSDTRRATVWCWFFWKRACLNVQRKICQEEFY